MSPGGVWWDTRAVLVTADAPRELSFVALVEPQRGRQAVLLCSADGVPSPDIAVSRGQGHSPLATNRGPSEPHFEVRATPTSLQVEMAKVEPGDEGLYLCSATNSHGSATASLRLEAPGEMSPKCPQVSCGVECPH